MSEGDRLRREAKLVSLLLLLLLLFDALIVEVVMLTGTEC
jgi:hypothetical protein